jgi:branched-chain amino acid transport system substrate-binding protein
MVASSRSRPVLMLRVVTLAIPFVVAGCGGVSPLPRRGGGDTAYVGVAVGLTSPERYAHLFEGVQLAFDSLNKVRPAGAPPLAIRRALADADSPVKIATAFRDNPAVVAVIGHTESDATLAAAPVYADREHDGRNPILAVTSATALAVSRVSPWIYRTNANVAEQGRVLARFVADSLTLRRAGVLYRNDQMGKDFVRAFADEFEKRGGAVIERDPFTESINDFDGYARRLAKEAAPSVVISGNSPQVREMIRALHRAGVSPAVLATNGPSASDTADFTGLRYVMLFSAKRPVSDVGAQFVSAFTNKSGHAPDHWGALGYDAALMIGRAVHETGADRKAIRDWFASIGRTRPAFAGAMGPITFDANRDPVGKPVLIEKVGR